MHIYIIYSSLSSFMGIYIIVPSIVAASAIKVDWTVLILKFYCGKTTPETNKTIKVSSNAEVK